jgi:hypothetical protein
MLANNEIIYPDSDRYILKGYQRGDDLFLDRIEVMDGWISPHNQFSILN